MNLWFTEADVLANILFWVGKQVGWHAIARPFLREANPFDRNQIDSLLMG